MLELIKLNKTGITIMFVFIVLDIITGILKAVLEHNLQSTKMREGLLHKIMEIVIVVMSYCLDILLNTSTLSTAVILFLVGMEGISILENVGNYIPLPAIIKNVLEQLKSKGGE